MSPSEIAALKVALRGKSLEEKNAKIAKPADLTRAKMDDAEKILAEAILVVGEVDRTDIIDIEVAPVKDTEADEITAAVTVAMGRDSGTAAAAAQAAGGGGEEKADLRLHREG